MSSPAESWDASAQRAGWLGLLWEKGYFYVQVEELSGKALHAPRRVGIFITTLE